MTVHLEPEQEVQLQDLFVSLASGLDGLGKKFLGHSVEAMEKLGKSAFSVLGSELTAEAHRARLQAQQAQCQENTGIEQDCRDVDGYPPESTAMPPAVVHSPKASFLASFERVGLVNFEALKLLSSSTEQQTKKFLESSPDLVSQDKSIKAIAPKLFC